MTRGKQRTKSARATPRSARSATSRESTPAPPGLSVRPLRLGDEDLLVFSWPLGQRAELPDVPALTTAERIVGQLLLEGHSDADIAAARGTSVRTVGKQTASIYRKLGISSRRELWARCRPDEDTESPG